MTFPFSPFQLNTCWSARKKIKKSGCNRALPGPVSATSLRRAQRGFPKAPLDSPLDVIGKGAAKNVRWGVTIIGYEEQFAIFKNYYKLQGPCRAFKADSNTHDYHLYKFFALQYHHQIHFRVPLQKSPIADNRRCHLQKMKFPCLMNE